VGPWNLPGSTASNGELAFFNASANVDYVPAPTVEAVSGSATSVLVTCEALGSVTLYNENGVAISSPTPCGEDLQVAVTTDVTVTPDTVLIAQQSVSGNSWLSPSTVTVGISPVPLGTAGTLKQGAVVPFTMSSLPGLTIDAGFIPTPSGGGTATLGGEPLGSGGASFTVPSSGSLAGVYTTGTASAGSDVITVDNDSDAFDGSDSYTYAVPEIVSATTTAGSDEIQVTYNEPVSCTATGTDSDWSGAPLGGSKVTGCSASGDQVDLMLNGDTSTSGALTYTQSAPTVANAVYAGTSESPAYAESPNPVNVTS